MNILKYLDVNNVQPSIRRDGQLTCLYASSATLTIYLQHLLSFVSRFFYSTEYGSKGAIWYYKQAALHLTDMMHVLCKSLSHWKLS